MQRRYLVIALALVVALVAITPTLGSSRQSLIDKSTFPVRTAKAAKRIAKTARTLATQAVATSNGAAQTANEAKDLANQAKSDAATAQTTANGAVTTANTAKSTADATAAELAGLRAKSDSDGPTVTTTEQNTYVDLGGPSVTVTVPPSGSIEVWAQATIIDGAVSLYDKDTGAQMPGQDPDDICVDFILAGPPPPHGPLLAVTGGPPSLTLGTPGAVGPFWCGTNSAPGGVLFKDSPGQHTYELRYAACGCNAPDPAEFSDRMLTVAPRP